MKREYTDLFDLPGIDRNRLFISFIGCTRCEYHIWKYKETYVCVKCGEPMDLIEMAVLGSKACIRVHLTSVGKDYAIEHRIIFLEKEWYRNFYKDKP